MCEIFDSKTLCKMKENVKGKCINTYIQNNLKTINKMIKLCLLLLLKQSTQDRITYSTVYSNNKSLFLLLVF